MKAIQISFDEDLLRQMDETDEVKREGRSALMRRAVAEYLLRHRQQRIADQYRTAYGNSGSLGDGFEGWEDEGQWPDD